MEDVIETRHAFGYVIIEGEYYEPKYEKAKPILKHVPKEHVEEQMRLAEEIANNLKDKTDVVAILIEAVMKLPEKEREKLHGMLFDSDRKYNVKTRRHHCTDMKIGNFVLPVVG